MRDAYREKGKDVDVRGLGTTGQIKPQFSKGQVVRVGLGVVDKSADGTKSERDLKLSDLKVPVPPKPKVDLQKKKDDFQGPPEQR